MLRAQAQTWHRSSYASSTSSGAISSSSSSASTMTSSSSSVSSPRKRTILIGPQCRYATVAKSDAPIKPHRHNLYRHSSAFAGEPPSTFDGAALAGARGHGIKYLIDEAHPVRATGGTNDDRAASTTRSQCEMNCGYASVSTEVTRGSGYFAFSRI